jgi:hypothetical protein
MSYAVGRTLVRRGLGAAHRWGHPELERATCSRETLEANTLGKEGVADHNLLSRPGSYGRRLCEVNLPSGSRAVSRWQWDEVSGSE